MVAKKAIILLSAIVLVIAQAPPEFQSSGENFYQSRQPIRVRQTGASKLFGWLGSRFAKIPYFLPRVPSFPKYVQQQQQFQQPYQQPQYQSVIIPDPSQTQPQTQGDSGPAEEINTIQDSSSPAYNFPEGQAYPDPGQNNIIPEKVPEQNAYEVVPSHMLSYQKEIMAPQSQWQPGFGGVPSGPMHPPPLYQRPQSTQVPIVPQSMGPDYFNTAYGHENQQSQSSNQQQFNYQAPAPPLSSQQYPQPNNNFGASFFDTQQQPPQQYNPQANFGATSGPIIGQPAAQNTNQQQAYNNQQQAYNNQQQQTYSPVQTSASFDLNQADFGTLLSTIDAGGQNYVGNDGFNVQSSQVVPVATRPPKKDLQSQEKNTDGFVASGIPGVKILSQSEDGGNPVFEVLADADAPSFGGHPFDINKLIAMIEPGAELVDAPQLSPSSSETKNVYQEAPATSGSGISDLFLSESHPEPSHMTVDGSKNKKPFSTYFSTTKNDSDKSKSSLKEIMDFFQQTGGKGYVVVEKKSSPQTNAHNLTDALTTDDDLTDGFSRLNITSETLPLLRLDKEAGNSLKYSIIPHDSTSKVPTTFNDRPTSSSSGFGPTKSSYSFKPLRPYSRKSFQSKVTRPFPSSRPVKFANITSPTVFFAVRSTTQHPNHNYNSTDNSWYPYPAVRETFPETVHTRPISDSDLINIQTVTQTPDGFEDLSFAESSQVKSIAITVTPPPHLTTTTTNTPTATPTSSTNPIPITKKSVISSTSSKKRPAPVYRHLKANKISNQTST